MKAARCLFNSRSALYRVFVSPAGLLEVPVSRAAFTLTQRSLLVSQPRFLTTTSPRERNAKIGKLAVEATEDDGKEEENLKYDRRYTTAATIKKANRDRMPQDHEITDPKIMVIDNGPPEGPLNTRFVLSKLTADESLRMLEPYKPADRKKGTRETLALCKIVNKREEYAHKQQVKATKQAQAKAKTKAMELTWAIGSHDLTTKMRQVAGFLDKGSKVDLTVARKKRSKTQVSPAEAEAILAKIREELLVTGVREHRPAEGVVGQTMRLYFEGTKKT
ncbi:hypothetical protein B0I35DRAFT_431368 [Stachybotrys elegans]|uniref:Translation initiation factor 3 N-terminal domain-containing protein n=1 Tax=Stachybotrys elegans TaxID=80388 RepID=A0A8K0SUL9_9HYPO|nr:hypothetical protein B0I35DRAFT_431368 [Stachybotrys elegans]